MSLNPRRVLTVFALGAVLVSAVPSRGEAAPAKDRSPAARSVWSWAPVAALEEIWESLWGTAAQASNAPQPGNNGQGSTGSTPVPPDPDKGPGIDPDGRNK